MFGFASSVESFVLNADCQYEWSLHVCILSEECGTLSTCPHLLLPISVPLYEVHMCVFVCMTVSLRPVHVGANERVCINACVFLFSLSQDEQSHPSSVLSNGGSGWLTLGPLIRPHLVGISLWARHSSCDTERNPDYPPPPAILSTISLFLFFLLMPFSLSRSLSLPHLV